jgi:hypothetical protein
MSIPKILGQVRFSDMIIVVMHMVSSPHHVHSHDPHLQTMISPLGLEGSGPSIKTMKAKPVSSANHVKNGPM